MTDVVMPQMGESIVEGTLTKWLKKAGERIERDEPLFEISTDKVDTEIPSPAAGTLTEVLVEEGATVSINAVVARIDEGGGAAEAPQKDAAAATEAPEKEAGTAPEAPQKEEAAAPEKQAPSPQAPPAPEEQETEETPEATAEEQTLEPTLPQAPAPDGKGEPEEEKAPPEPSGPISPLVRRMAREQNLDLSKVRGTGAGGRVTKQDVENYLAQRKAAAPPRDAERPPAPPPQQPQAAQPAQPRPQAPAAAAQQPPAMPVPPQAGIPRTRIEPMSTMRIKIAEHMVMSKRTSAHVTTVHRVDMTKVAKLRERNKTEFEARHGFGLTYLPFIARATVEGLRTYPLVNASIEGNNVLYHNEINLGIAVALENGLIVPVIRTADEKNVLGLQRAIVDLATRARARQLKPDEVQGGTFSITNFGSFGSVWATPVINQPQVGILGVGAVEKLPVVLDDAIAIRSVCYLSLTFDHRLIDGALADQFTAKVKSVLEGWSEQVL
jgi:2-oxoglutarate dehydrogenase E2 component (dihydrolipoamide succinyltransferase)